MTTVLDRIIAYKKEEVATASTRINEQLLLAEAKRTPPPRGFQHALQTAAQTGPALIAEIKKASPSKGLIRADFDPPAHARAYAAGGAACLSVLTDTPSFMGHKDYLETARAAVNLPILRKDFMISPYQVIEARTWGADAILIIMACTDDTLARELMSSANDLDLDALVEVHDEAEMERALAIDAQLIGINNRNLKTFETDLRVTERLARLAPSTCFLVAESGIANASDIRSLQKMGAKGFLIGESLMRHDDIEQATRALLAM